MIFKLIEIVIVTIINVVSFFLIIIVGSNSLKIKLHRWFIMMTIFMIGWVDFSYLGVIEENFKKSIFFYNLNGMFVVGYLFSAYIFYIEIFFKAKKTYLKWTLGVLSSIFIVLFIFTDVLIQDVVVQEWGNEIVFGQFNSLFNIFSLSVVSILIYYFIKKHHLLPTLEKQKVSYFLLGTFFLIFFNVIFNVISPLLLNTTKYQHFGDYSVIIFLGFTAFAILKHKFLGVKIALVASLVSVVGMLLIIDIIALSDNLLEQSIKILLFTLFVGVSIILVRSVLEEIKQKEALIKMNLSLDQSKKRYFKLASTQKDIIDVMGHEIRTPLTAISQEMKLHKKYTLPIADQLLTEVKPNGKLENILPMIFDTLKTTGRATSHALSLVVNMLETARLDKKRLVLNYEKFDLLKVIKESITLMRKTLDEELDSFAYDIQFVDSKQDSLIIEADRMRVTQAIYALLNNALKYRDQSKKFSKIRIQVNLKRNSLKIKRKSVQIEIKDNGLGLKAGDIPRLGRKFFRIEAKSSDSIKKPGGTGLGLFVVKGIMKYHHGKLLITSRGIKKGSTFTLHFPVKR